ncbi:MAG: AIR carboxylase family protein [Bacteroidetes bacterium]|nr:AIR carboxylase family protein [Bacteroidota bacterium]
MKVMIMMGSMVTAQSQRYGAVVAATHTPVALSGVCVAYTSLPVLGVHLAGGIDSLYSIVQMRANLPVGTLAAGRSGAQNAAVTAARIFAFSDKNVAERVEAFKQQEYEI